VDAQNEILSLQKSIADGDANLAKVTKGRRAAITTVTDLARKLRASETSREDEVAALQATAEKEEAKLAKMTRARTWALTNFRETEAELAKVSKGRDAAIITIKDLVGKLRAAQSERDALADDKLGLEQSIADAEASLQAEKDRVAGVSAVLADELSAAGVGNVSVSPIEDNQAVGITMGSSDLYRIGSANLSSRGIELLNSVGSVVSNYGEWRIDVEGHTDGQPIGSALSRIYATNWELSVARATAAVRYLQSTVGIPAEKLSVRGFGEHKPVDTNDTSEGREANRRIELILRK